MRERAGSVGERVWALRERVRASRGGRIAWRIGVTVVGVGTIVVGIVLLPLPGPGWLIIFAGLGLLATEYVWARRLLRFARGQLTRWSRWVYRQNRIVQTLIGLAGLIFLAGLAVLGWWVYNR